MLLQNQQSQQLEPFSLGPISHNPLIASLRPIPLRMAPQLNSLSAPDVGQVEVEALPVYSPLSFPKIGTIELTSNLHTTSRALYSTSQTHPHPGLSFLCFYSQL